MIGGKFKVPPFIWNTTKARFFHCLLEQKLAGNKGVNLATCCTAAVNIKGETARMARTGRGTSEWQQTVVKWLDL
jgi:hypothetical protein